jgi:hypothetical protein
LLLQFQSQGVAAPQQPAWWQIVAVVVDVTADADSQALAHAFACDHVSFMNM